MQNNTQILDEKKKILNKKHEDMQLKAIEHNWKKKCFFSVKLIMYVFGDVSFNWTPQKNSK